MNNISIEKNKKELEGFIKKANRKLLEFEIAQSEWEIAHGKIKVFKSAKEIKSYMKSKYK